MEIKSNDADVWSVNEKPRFALTTFGEIEQRTDRIPIAGAKNQNLSRIQLVHSWLGR